MAPRKVFLTGLVIGGGLAFLFGPGSVRWMELRAQRERLKAEVASLQAENRRLYEETRRLREDPSHIETVARRQLGFVRPGETVIKFREPERR